MDLPSENTQESKGKKNILLVVILSLFVIAFGIAAAYLYLKLNNAGKGNEIADKGPVSPVNEKIEVTPGLFLYYQDPEGFNSRYVTSVKDAEDSVKTKGRVDYLYRD